MHVRGPIFHLVMALWLASRHCIQRTGPYHRDVHMYSIESSVSASLTCELARQQPYRAPRKVDGLAQSPAADRLAGLPGLLGRLLLPRRRGRLQQQQQPLGLRSAARLLGAEALQRLPGALRALTDRALPAQRLRGLRALAAGLPGQGAALSVTVRLAHVAAHGQERARGPPEEVPATTAVDRATSSGERNSGL